LAGLVVGEVDAARSFRATRAAASPPARAARRGSNSSQLSLLPHSGDDRQGSRARRPEALESHCGRHRIGTPRKEPSPRSFSRARTGHRTLADLFTSQCRQCIAARSPPLPTGGDAASRVTYPLSRASAARLGVTLGTRDG